MAGHRRQRASTRDPEHEARMELAVKDVADRTYKTISAVAMDHKASEFSESQDLQVKRSI